MRLTLLALALLATTGCSVSILQPQTSELLTPTGEHPQLGPIDAEAAEVPAPAETIYARPTPDLRDPSTARLMAMESSYLSQRLWLYKDGNYAQGQAQKITGVWKDEFNVMTLSPDHGGRVLFSKGEDGVYRSAQGSATILREALP